VQNTPAVITLFSGRRQLIAADSERLWIRFVVATTALDRS
jgi:hypothetical protein